MRKHAGYLLLSLLLLAGCEQEEAFSDARTSGPILGGDGSGAFDPSSPNEGDKQGRFILGEVRNLAYSCGGFHGRIGVSGTEEEQERGRFRCPSDSEDVEFYLGGGCNQDGQCDGSGERWVLGKEIFKENVRGQTVDLTPLDIVDSPYRISWKENQPVNIAALLMALDTGEGGENYIHLPNAAHRLFFLEEYAPPSQNEFELTFENFTSQGSYATGFLSAVENAMDSKVAGFPGGRQDVEGLLEKSARASLAGIYVLDIPSLFSRIVYPEQDHVFTDALSRSFAGAAFFPGVEPIGSCAGEFDESGSCPTDPLYSPVIFIDRMGNMFGGGPFWTVDQEETFQLFSSGAFASLESGGALKEDLSMVRMESGQEYDGLLFETLDDDLSTIIMRGRFIRDYTYTNVNFDEDDLNNDFVFHYPGLETPPENEGASMTVDITTPGGEVAQNDHLYFMSRQGRFFDSFLDSTELSDWGLPGGFRLRFFLFRCADDGDTSLGCIEDLEEEAREKCEDDESTPEEVRECISEFFADIEIDDVLMKRGGEDQYKVDFVIDADGMVFLQGAEECTYDANESRPVGVVTRAQSFVDFGDIVDDEDLDPDDSIEEELEENLKTVRIELFFTGDAQDKDLIPQMGTRVSGTLDIESGSFVSVIGETDAGQHVARLIDNESWYDTRQFVEKARNIAGLVDPEDVDDPELSEEVEAVFSELHGLTVTGAANICQ